MFGDKAFTRALVRAGQGSRWPTNKGPTTLASRPSPRLLPERRSTEAYCICVTNEHGRSDFPAAKLG